MLREISPHAVAHAVFCKPHDLRLWRQSGLLNGIGERCGKGHLFSSDEVRTIAASVRLARCNVPFADAFEIVAHYRRQIALLDPAASSDDLVLRVTMQPGFDHELVRSKDAPLALVTFETGFLARAEVNLSEISRSVGRRINDFAHRHAA
jgi:hypothetical protein